MEATNNLGVFGKIEKHLTPELQKANARSANAAFDAATEILCSAKPIEDIDALILAVAFYAATNGATTETTRAANALAKVIELNTANAENEAKAAPLTCALARLSALG